MLNGDWFGPFWSLLFKASRVSKRFNVSDVKWSPDKYNTVTARVKPKRKEKDEKDRKSNKVGHDLTIHDPTHVATATSAQLDSTQAGSLSLAAGHAGTCGTGILEQLTS
jgi:hypothetical protein